MNQHIKPVKIQDIKPADCSKLTYGAMAWTVHSINVEVKRRNPLFCNAYCAALNRAVAALAELHFMQQRNPKVDETP